MLTLDPNERVTAEQALRHPFLQGVDVNEVFDDVGRPRRSRGHKSESKPKFAESKTSSTTPSSTSPSTTSSTSGATLAVNSSPPTVVHESPPESPLSATFIVSDGS